MWDLFESGKQRGGAPANFACHCKRLGARAETVSAVGSDELGDELIRDVEGLGLDTQWIQRSPSLPTGTVQVELDEQGHPSYEICKPVAWDAVEITEELMELAADTDAACFGTLAQREPVSRRTIRRFLQEMPEHALRIFDVNLRQDFYDQEVLETSLRLATVLKLSDEELSVLSEVFDISGTIEEQLHAFQKKFELVAVAYTRGGEGSRLIHRSESSDRPGTSVDIKDTVGAGDSFTASLCMGLLHQLPLERTHELADRVSAYVCTQSGATPELPEELKRLLL